MKKIETLYPSNLGNIRPYITHQNIRELAPFVLFDALTVDTSDRWGFPWHSHSGVATLTFPYTADLHHDDTGHNGGVILSDGFQWMAAGGGIWHSEHYQPKNGFIGAHQLWVQLPPEEEEEPVKYIDRKPDEIPTAGNTRVLIGKYEGVESSAAVPADMTYLDVSLNKGDVWHFSPPDSQIRGFVFARRGKLQVGDVVLDDHVLGKFRESNETLEITAQETSQFVVALVAPSPYPIVHEYGQIHTKREALERSKIRIKDLGLMLREKGIL